MFSLINFFQIKFMLGYLKNQVFPSKLSDEEEEILIDELLDKEKQNSARNKLILHNLRLVAHICKKYESKLTENEDLISIGTIGLIKAIDTYSKDKKVKLATYASRCIENEILMVLRSNKKHSKNVSLSDTIAVDKDGSEVELIDVLSSDENDFDEILEKNRLLSELTKYINILDEREYMIIALRYGLDGNDELTQKEIANMYNISRSYVSRIEKRALSKLLGEFKKNKII